MRRLFPFLVLGLLSLLPLPQEPRGVAHADDRAAAKKPVYPETRRVDEKDVLHGVDVPDPYRWLEDDASKEVEAWDHAQNALLRARLDPCPGRAELKQKLEAELNQGTLESLPRFAGAFSFHTYRAPGDNHAVLYVRDVGSQEPPRVVIDPNAWSSDGTQGMKQWWPSPDGRYVAYERDAKGSEATTIYVQEVATGTTLPDAITRTKFTSVAWRPDARSFYYTRLPDPDDVPADQRQYHRRVRLHQLGTMVLDDVTFYGADRPLLESCWVDTSRDEQHRFLARENPDESIDSFELDESASPPKVVPLVVGTGSRTFVERTGETFVLNTDLKAPRRRVCTASRADLADPARWKEIVPAGEAVIEDVLAFKDRVVVKSNLRLEARLAVVSLAGEALGSIALPGPGTVRNAATKPGDPRLWFSFESYSVPMSNWVVDLSAAPEGTGKEARWTPTRTGVLPTTLPIDELVSERFDVTSKDGTKVPLFVLHRKDVPLDGRAPTVLYGYGGFRVGLVPSFSRAMGVWASLGGVYCVASLRGGDEFGEEWHEAGSLAKKQNCFDDFIACGDWLVSSGKAKREKLAIMGGSNGGLLVAAVTNQRPDLCRAVVCSVPLTDMLRYHRFQYAKYWTTEYGSPDVKEQFDWIRPYSPYHNVKPGAAYPAALVTAGLSDGRVNAFHARKIVAEWQRATTSDRPILLHLDRDSGHGAASLKQAKDEILDRFCFLRQELGGP